MNKYNTLQKGIKHLKKIREVNEKLSKAFKFLDDDFGFITLGWIESDYLDLLEEAVGDKYSWIAYYVYYCEFGKDPKKIILRDGTEIKMNSIKNLYKMICE